MDVNSNMCMSLIFYEAMYPTLHFLFGQWKFKHAAESCHSTLKNHNVVMDTLVNAFYLCLCDLNFHMFDYRI